MSEWTVPEDPEGVAHLFVAPVVLTHGLTYTEDAGVLPKLEQVFGRRAPLVLTREDRRLLQAMAVASSEPAYTVLLDMLDRAPEGLVVSGTKFEWTYMPEDATRMV